MPYLRTSDRQSSDRRSRRIVCERLEERTLLAGDLVAHWRAADLLAQFGDGEHIPQWVDSVSSIAADGFGTPTLAGNFRGGRPAIRFDSIDEKDGFRVAKDSSPMSGAADFSVAVYFSTTNIEPGNVDDWFNGVGLVHANQNGIVRDWGIALHGGQVAAGIGRNLFQPSNSVLSTQTNINDGTPHLVVFTRQAGTLTLHVDDAAPVIAEGASLDPRDAIELIFGVPNLQQGEFLGDIAEVRIYNGALDTTEVSDLNRDIDSFYDNAPPVANDDHYVVDEDGTLFVGGAGVLSNDSDAEGDTLTASVVQPPSNGELGLNPNGTFIYVPHEDFFGIDTFTYSANDFRDSIPATVTIDVRPTDDPAVAIGDSYKAVPTTALSVDATLGVLANDINTDQVPISAQLLDDVNFGALDLREDGSFTYDAQGTAGLAVFSYQILDRDVLSDPVSVLIVVNSPPTVVDDSFTVAEDSTLALNATEGIGANDQDFDGDRLRFSVIDLPANGELIWDEDGSIEYRPELNFNGQDSFTYLASDGTDESDVATVTLSVTPVNDLPVVRGEAYFVSPGTPLEVSVVRGLLANDSDVEDEKLTVGLVTAPAHGQLQLEPDGSFRYAPNVDYDGIDEFSYVVRDSDGAEVTADVRLHVGTSPVLISEVMAANATTLQTSVRDTPTGRFEADILTPDWIELENISNEVVDISGLFLSDNLDNVTKWQIPNGTVVPAHGFLVVLATRLDINDPRLDELGLLHTNFKLRSEAGEFLGLFSPDGRALDTINSLPESRPDFSFGRHGDSMGYLDEPTPAAPNSALREGLVADVVFSKERGFYDAPIEIELSVETPDAAIYYTLNGSPPAPETGIAYSNPITITTTANLRAAAFKDNYVPSLTTTHSYFFIEDILRQPSDPEGFPDRWGSAGAADYGMDPDVATDTESDFYDPNVIEGLMSLPSISLTVDVEEFFGARGIQSNPQSKGDQWERATSVEFIGFEHFEDAQFNSGIRMVGNASRNPNRAKHNMRLAFRDDYGDSNLSIPLFGLGDSEEHENLILRGGNGDSWVNPGVVQRAQYIRDQWQRDLQFAMGHLSTHQLYSHLYINGLYWGLYHVFERHDASFMALHLGGDAENYDAIKDVNGNTAAVEPVSGDIDGWEAIFDIVDDRDISDEEKYEEVQQRVDVDNMIDYLLINFYAGNNDWDHNNFRTGRNRDGKFIFFTWDAERSDINALGVPNAGGPISIDVTSFNKAGRPTHIHQRLRNLDDYAIRFADRVQKHFFNNGVLTPNGAGGFWNARADEIRLAMSAESARWGDLHSSARPYTVANWESTLARMNDEFFPNRTDIVLSQLRRRGFYPDVDAPIFSQLGGTITDTLELSMEADNGVIYYSTDGQDPRLSGGDISPMALTYEQPISISTDTTVKARVLLDGEWSALVAAAFETMALPADVNSLRISEIHFNPAAPSEQEIEAGIDDSDEFEFIELVNIASHPIDLQNVELMRIENVGVSFDFGLSDIERLQPGERVLVVENTQAFKLRYGDNLPVAGQWSGRLSNRRETIYLGSAGEVFLQLSYDDMWYPETDGDGKSLEVINPAAVNFSVWETAAGWRPSEIDGGTPGKESTQRVPGDSNGDGVFNSSDLVLVFQAGEYEDTIVGNSTFEEGDWNGDGDFDSSDLVFVFRQGTFVAEASASLDANRQIKKRIVV